jgi:hypothetical protein
MVGAFCPLDLRTETDAVSETLCSLGNFWNSGLGTKAINSVTVLWKKISVFKENCRWIRHDDFGSRRVLKIEAIKFLAVT